MSVARRKFLLLGKIDEKGTRVYATEKKDFVVETKIWLK